LSTYCPWSASFPRYSPHSLRASRVLWDEPLWGSPPPSGLAASASPQAAKAERWGSSVPPASSLTPVGCPSPLPGISTGPLLLGPAPRLSGHACRVVQNGLCSRAPFLLPSSGATEPLGGLAANTRGRSWAAAHSAATVAATLSRRSWAAATVAQASWEPPSPSRAPVVLFLQSRLALADISPPVPPPDDVTLGRFQLLVAIVPSAP
jgi:hypothetical protein